MEHFLPEEKSLLREDHSIFHKFSEDKSTEPTPTNKIS